MIKVHQLLLERKNGVCEDKDLLHAYRELTFNGSESWDYSYFDKYFTEVCTVDSDDLDECFIIMNRWSDDDESRVSNYTWKEGIHADGSSYRVRALHSLSIGDILERDGKFFMVEPAGFCELSSMGVAA